jgi:hypothetical protein
MGQFELNAELDGAAVTRGRFPLRDGGRCIAGDIEFRPMEPCRFSTALERDRILLNATSPASSDWMLLRSWQRPWAVSADALMVRLPTASLQHSSAGRVATVGADIA